MANKEISVLIVEDDTMISNMYKLKLENDGYRVITADNGADGLTAAKEKKPDIVLLDIILPQLDGFSVLKEIKGEEKTRKIPVVMLTNLGTEEDIEKGKQFGAEGYIVKANYTPAQVSEEIKKYLK
jgi:two-component system alkaline phosphatase synthesis response regulator PhoP